MNDVDSSGRLEYFADGPNADFFAKPIENTLELVVPSISIYEVSKRVLQQRDENAALEAIALMAQGHVVDLDTALALNAAKLSDELKLPMADSIKLATARAYNAVLWTQDADLNIEGVRYIEKNDKQRYACPLNFPSLAFYKFHLRSFSSPPTRPRLPLSPRQRSRQQPPPRAFRQTQRQPRPRHLLPPPPQPQLRL